MTFVASLGTRYSSEDVEATSAKERVSNPASDAGDDRATGVPGHQRTDSQCATDAPYIRKPSTSNLTQNLTPLSPTAAIPHDNAG